MNNQPYKVPGLASVIVKFQNEKLNYSTMVNGKSSDAKIRDYFVNTTFNLSSCDANEIMAKCIDIEILR